jgi:phosphatidate cytidylyltransferase
VTPPATRGDDPRRSFDHPHDAPPPAVRDGAGKVDPEGFSSPPAFAGRTLVTLITGGGFGALAWADASGLGNLRAGWWLMPVALLVVGGGVEELCRLYESVGIRLPRMLLAGGGMLVLLASAAGPVDRPIGPLASAAMALTGLSVGLCIDAVARYRPHAGAIHRLAACCLTVMIFCLPMAFLVCLRFVLPADAPSGRHGILPLASMVAVVKGGDVAAYLVGASIGRTPMAPALSPRKTWEGAVASLLASLAASWLAIGTCAPEGTGPWGGWAVYGMLVGAAGMVGDLTESLLKRELHVKDSGRLLAALGGVLDLVDAFLLAAPVAWLLWFAGGAG